MKNVRSSVRRPAKRSSRATCQKGSLGLGADLALRLVDLSETGVRLLLRTELGAGQEVEVGILAQGQGRPVRRLANVVWCVAAEAGYVAGLRFQRALGYAEYQQLT